MKITPILLLAKIWNYGIINSLVVLYKGGAVKSKKGLRPRTIVQNILTKSIGITLADPKKPRSLRDAHPLFIWVEIWTPRGKKRRREKGRKTCWYIKNVDLAKFTALEKK